MTLSEYCLKYQVIEHNRIRTRYAACWHL